MLRKDLLMTIMILLLSICLTGCQNMNNQEVGTITGGVAGGILGSTIGGGDGRLLAVAAGTLAGAFVGSAVGKNMDDTDRLKMKLALENNDIGQPAYWRNARTHNTYRVVPVRNVTVHHNRYCREYRTIATIAGRKQEIYGTACRQPDGSWRVVN